MNVRARQASEPQMANGYISFVYRCVHRPSVFLGGVVCVWCGVVVAVVGGCAGWRGQMSFGRFRSSEPVSICMRYRY